MLITIATALAGLIAAAVILMGSSFFWAPQGAAGFGIPGTPTEGATFHAWLRVKGVRDMAAGVLLLIVLIGGTSQLLGWILLAAAAIPLGDMLIVLRSKGPRPAAFGVHGATAAVMVAVSALLLVG